MYFINPDLCVIISLPDQKDGLAISGEYRTWSGNPRYNLFVEIAGRPVARMSTARFSDDCEPTRFMIAALPGSEGTAASVTEHILIHIHSFQPRTMPYSRLSGSAFRTGVAHDKWVRHWFEKAYNRVRRLADAVYPVTGTQLLLRG